MPLLPAALALLVLVDGGDLQGSDRAHPLPAGWREGGASRAARRALDDGLAYLARRQAETEDGSFPKGDEQEYAPVGVTALGVLAFMAAGNSPGRGPHGPAVRRAIDYLLEKTDLAPESDTYGYVSSGADTTSRMHGHGYATLALAEVYGMAQPSQRLERALLAAVRLIERSQGSEGGWEYEPRAIANHEGSVTICLVQALRAARNAGVRVDADVIEQAEDYVVRLQKPDGTFRYTLQSEDSSVALTAAAVSTLNMAGRYDDAVVKSAIDAVWSGLALAAEDPQHRSRFPFYERLHLAQAFWQLTDDTHFERWFAEERARVLRQQRKDGSWENRRFGDCYATAVNCLVLAIPEGVLPIFQR